MLACEVHGDCAHRREIADHIDPGDLELGSGQLLSEERCEVERQEADEDVATYVSFTRQGRVPMVVEKLIVGCSTTKDGRISGSRDQGETFP